MKGPGLSYIMEETNETKGDRMTYIREEALTPSEAKNLEHAGFRLEFVRLGLSKDTYKIYAK